MHSRLTLLIAGPLLLAASQAIAQRDTRDESAAELALSNDTLQLRYLGSGNAIAVQGSRVTGGVFLGEERDFVLSAGLLFPVDLGVRRLEISFGPQVYAALLQEENDDVMAVSVGAEARFLIDPARRLAVSGQAYYAPDILTFGTADNLTDLSARVEFGVAEQLLAFAGMRWFEFDLTNGEGENTLQEEVFVGIGYQF